MDAKKLIEEVLLDLSNNKTLTDVSTKIQIIVRLLGDENLKTWYSCEFVTGYKGEDFPDYRISQAADIKADYIVPQGFGAWKISGQSVPVANLGIEKYKQIMTVRFGDTISAIIDYSKHPADLVMSLSPHEQFLVQKVLGEAQVQSVHKVLSPSTFQTIIDGVQGKIVDMFMDLNEKVFNGELDLHSTNAKREIQQVINNYITAGIVQTGAGTIDASEAIVAANYQRVLDSELKDKLNLLVNKIEDLANNSNDEFDEIAQEIVDIRSELASSNPIAKNLRKSFKAITWGISVSGKAAIEKLVNNAIDLLSNVK